MKAKKLIATGLVASMLMLALTGCGAGGNSGESAKDTDKGSVYFLNFKSELSSEWEEVAGTFTKETGIDMKVVTAGSGTYEQTLKSELSKKEMPTLFNINGPIGYQTWKNYCADLKDSQIYEWLTDKDMAITDGRKSERSSVRSWKMPVFTNAQTKDSLHLTDLLRLYKIDFGKQ